MADDKKKWASLAENLGNIKEGFKFVSQFNIGKIILILGIIVAAIFSALSFGVFGGLLVIVGLFIIWLMFKSPNVLGFVGSVVKGIAFAGVLVVILFFLSVYTPFPPLLLLVIEGILLILFIAKIDAKAGMVTIIILMVLAPSAHQYASLLPENSALAQSVTSIEQQLSGSLNIISPKRISEQIQRDVKRQIALASGEYYTSRVDAGAKKQLGVFMDEVKTTQKLATFFVGEPVNFFTKITARALDFNVKLNLRCGVDGIVGKVSPVSEELFGSAGASEENSKIIDVDCVFPKEQTKDWSAGSRTAKISALFNFATLGYLDVYFMDKEKKNELDRRNLLMQWKASLPSADGVSVTTSGPVRVGIGVGDLPLGVAPTDEDGPAIGISFDNAGSGEMTSLSQVMLMLPKGLLVADVNGDSGVVRKISCVELDESDQRGCDDDGMEVYLLDAPRTSGPQLQMGVKAKETWTGENIKFDLVSLRIHTKIGDYGALVGSGATAVPKKVWAKVVYDYALSKEKTFSVRVPVNAHPEVIS
ncbi:hypothetical protein HY485_00505 [Candidatus Woesearchaeota archaeon]|nr:hypothetical protein [Candidatus Woesearchaeota archaeon]